MANGNFIVQNGLTVGAVTIDATSGNITTTGVFTTTNSEHPAEFQGNLTVGGSLLTLNGVAIEALSAGGGSPTTYGAGAEYSIPGITFDNPGELQFSSADFTSTAGLACKAALLTLGSGDTLQINSMHSGGSGVWTATLTSAFTTSDGGTTYIATYTSSVTPFMYSWEIIVAPSGGPATLSIGTETTVSGDFTANAGTFTTGTFTTLVASSWANIGESIIGTSTINTGTLTAGTANPIYLNVGNDATVGGATTLSTATTGGLQAKAIGNVTPGSGAFTTLTNSGVHTISNATETTAVGNGALVVSGGASIAGNTYVANNLYIGSTSFNKSLTTPTIIAVDNGSNYAQIAMINSSGNGSADFAAYADNGTDSAGWVDVGIAGSTFSDVNYTITKAHDGYLITKPLNNTYGGNLVISTSELGTTKDIVIGVGGFSASSEVARFHGNVSTNGTLTIKYPTTTTSSTTGALVVTGGVGIGGDLTVQGNINASYLNTVSSSQLSVTSPLVYLTGQAYPYTYDIGMYSHFIGGPANVYTHTGGVRSYQNGYWGFFSNVKTEPAGTVNWTDAGLIWDTIKMGGAIVANTTAATSTTSGALTVAGGAGIAGAIYAGSIQGTPIGSTSTSTGAFTTLTAQTETVGGLQAVAIGNVTPGSGAFTTLSASSTVSGAGFSTYLASPPAIGGTAAAAGSFTTLSASTSVTTPSIAHSGTSGTGDIGASGAAFGTVWATATSAKYADLAENYQADDEYTPGQVLMFGGDAEVTLADADTFRVAGVVSTNPAHLMNGQLRGNRVVPIALQGRVPCNVIGPVRKGDLMVSAGFGFAKTLNAPRVGQVIGKALEDFTGAKGVIEVVVGRV